MLTIEQLRYVSVAVSAGGYSAAARKLYVTPQAVSRAVRQLERIAGGRLFRNIDGAMAPTREGRMLAARIDKALDLYDEIGPFATSLFRAENDQLHAEKLA